VDDAANSDFGANDTAAPRAAVRLYSAIYPNIRSALIDIGRLPGPTCLDEDLRRCATADLRLTLEMVVDDAKVPGLVVGEGEPFSGMANSEKDRWLPEISTGECKTIYHRILLSSAAVPLYDNMKGFVCQHPSVEAWRRFFTHKYPSISFRGVPLYSNPIFPGLWNGTDHQCIDANPDFQNAPVAPLEAVEVLISWIGRTMVKNTMQMDDESTRMCAGGSLRSYVELRPDLVNAVNAILADSIAHGLLNWADRVERAAHFLHDTLAVLRDKAGERDPFAVESGNKPTYNSTSAHHWLPIVRARPRKVASDIRPPPTPNAMYALIAEGNHA
jgi:hypothetical protein